MTEPTAAGRKVWLLTDDRPGNRTQAIGVARALGWPFEEKRLAFNARARRAAPLLGATLKTLDDASRGSIAPPWPDLVIGAGRRVGPVARFVRKASGGRARVVLVGRRTPGGFADLTIRCAYFRQVPDARLVELALPPTQVDAAALDEARTWPDPLAGHAGPRCVFLVGGPTGQHDFDAAFAGRMAGEVAAAAVKSGASLAIVTSRRTPPDAIEAMRRAAPGAHLHVWSPGAASSAYLSFLARADLIVVTGESESMLAEAAATGRPLTIYPLAPRAMSRRQRVRAAVARLALGEGPLSRPARRLMADGWVMPRRDLTALHRMIEERGWGKVFAGALNLETPEPRDEDGVIARRIAALFEPARERGA
jgi:mitochondrial fission protein ELM1